MTAFSDLCDLTATEKLHLHYCAKYERGKAVVTLVQDLNASPTIKDKDGKTPLDLADGTNLVAELNHEAVRDFLKQ